jgi:hypothetical protein
MTLIPAGSWCPVRNQDITHVQPPHSQLLIGNNIPASKAEIFFATGQKNINIIFF